MTRRVPIEGETTSQPRARCWLAPRSGGARLHAGVDLGRRAGVPVLAPEAGRVLVVAQASYAGDTPRGSSPAGWSGYGPWVVLLDGASGAYHVLAHLEVVDVRQGSEVEAGEQVAVIAARGRHLHWEVRARRQPPRGWATVEVSANPGAWLATGELDVYNRRDHGCPQHPEDTTKTPRACRPSAAAAFEPEPEPEPEPEHEPEPGPEMEPETESAMDASDDPWTVGPSRPFVAADGAARLRGEHH